MNRLQHLFLVIMLVTATAAQADEFHHNNVLIGDRAAGMGGAYTAISDDASGPYYNPAGMAFTKGRNISVSVNTFNVTNTDYLSAFNNTNWERTSSSLLPNFFGYVQTFDSGVFGFSYAMPDNIDEDQNQRYGGFASSTPGVNVNEYIINLKSSDKTYLLGPSYALEISPTLAVGATLYLHYRKRETINNQLLQLSNSTDQWFNQYYQTSETGLRPILGIMWTPLDKFSFGATLSTTFIQSATSKLQTTNKPTTSGTTTLAISDDHDKRDLPVSFALGAAWFPSSSLLYSLDVTRHSATHDSTQSREATVNMAMGVEYYPTSRWAVRGGLFTNFAATPEIDPSRVNQQEHVDLFGLSTSLTRVTSGASITGGVTYAQGSGKAQLFSNIPTVVAVERRSLTLFMSTSTTY